MKTILIVDDEPLIRAYVREVVEDAGFVAKEAGTADEALKLIEDDGVDVLLSDVEMPGVLDGVDLAWAVRSRWPSMVVVLISGRRLPRRDQLPDDTRFLAKPFSPDGLVDAMTRSS